MGVFFLKAFIETISRLVGVRRCEKGERKLRGVLEFQRESKSRLVMGICACKSYSSVAPLFLRTEPNSVSCVNFKRSLNSLGGAGNFFISAHASSTLA